jgi:O-antigen/teichoic acid export membrane protein
MMPARVLVLGEQGLLSAANLIGNILIARHYSQNQYAAFSFAFAAYVFLSGIQRAAIIIPFVVSAHDEGPSPAARAFCHANFRLTAAVALPAVAIGLACHAANLDWWGDVFFGAGLLCAGLFPYELCRRWLLQRKLYGQLLAMTTAYIAALLTVLLASVRFDIPLFFVFIGMASSTLVALACTLRMLRRPPDASTSEPSLPPGFRLWNVLSHLSYSGYNFAIQAIQAATIARPELSAFYATRNIFQPIQVLVMAVDNTDKPRAARAFAASGKSGLYRSLITTSLSLLALGAPYLLCVAFFHDSILHYLYNGKFDHSAGGGLLWIFPFALMMVAQPIETGIYVIKKTKVLFITRIIAAIIGILASIVLTQRFGYQGAIISIGAGWLIAACGGFIGLIKSAKA